MNENTAGWRGQACPTLRFSISTVPFLGGGVDLAQPGACPSQESLPRFLLSECPAEGRTSPAQWQPRFLGSLGTAAYMPHQLSVCPWFVSLTKARVI